MNDNTVCYKILDADTGNVLHENLSLKEALKIAEQYEPDTIIISADIDTHMFLGVLQ